MSAPRPWADDQKWEAAWWGTCANTLGEEWKQLAYAKRMGLVAHHDGKSPFNFDLGGKSVLDIGGGPCSLLLKCANGRGLVVDPCEYPEWVAARYMAAGIKYGRLGGERLSADVYGLFDEVWVYNVLQHVEDPGKIITNARRLGKIIRLFEWIDTGTAPGHAHNLTEVWLNEQLGGEGKVEEINDHTAVGRCYYGIFKGDGYGV